MASVNQETRPKPSNPKKKIISTIAGILGALVLIPILIYGVILIGFVHVWSTAEDEANKQRPKDAALIKAEVARYNFSSGCSHSSQDTDAGDTFHTYNYVANYECPVNNWGSLHDEITGDLQNLGYGAERDSIVTPLKPGDNYSTFIYSAELSYVSACCRVKIEPDFINVDASTPSLAVFRSQPLKSYSITVSVYR